MRVKGNIKVIVDGCVNETKSVPLSRCHGDGVVSPGSLSDVHHGTIYEAIAGLRRAGSASSDTLQVHGLVVEVGDREGS